MTGKISKIKFQSWCSLAHALTLLLVLVSCVPSQEAGTSRRSSAATTETTTTPTPDAPIFNNSGEVFWYSGTSSFDSIITVNEDISTVIYIRGEAIHNFLSNSFDGSTLNQNQTYCLVASYTSSGAKNNLRARAVPISITNFQTNSLERLLRIDLPDSSSNTSTCTGSALNISTTADAGVPVLDAQSAFIPENLCTNCTNTISSTDISLYLADNGLSVLNRIPESSLNLGELVMRVDTRSSSTDQTGTCSDNACSAKGFDCCLDGQCVNDGTLRPNASTEDEFFQALADVGVNPDNFINWPNIYFVCGTRPSNPVATPTPFPDAQATANARLQEMIKDFNCLEEGKKDSPDFSGNAVCEPSFDQTSFEAVRSKVWAYCGCEADPFPTDPDDPACPDFGLEAIRDTSGTITAIECFTPIPPALPTPFQNLSLSVNTRSAPHRFFREDTGESVDDITTLETTVQVEGVPFQYIDNSSKTDPDCSGDVTGLTTADCIFNLNSILGQFNVALDQARPATVVNLDFDQTYIISTVSGFYTPCPSCAADYWNTSFSPFPGSQQGVGLESNGYQTNRENYGNNTGRGNYEDTHFGRACFLPPTMIPLSHKPSASGVTQRRNRLLTQTALWVNGYQRDWYGFNKGALIGSFDGVEWFAIGKSRRVTSTTGKLFLAINSPFADLADSSDFTVQIVVDQGNSIAPNFDFDPALNPNHEEQNTGATCQYYHQCDTDTDCVTQLGWEYMCVDTNNFRTRWPKFDVEADELVNDEFDNANITRIIQGGLPSGSKKRCVYRGAGAVCKRDYTQGLVNNRRKMFACAPNFHCASLDSSEFNNRVARTPNKVTNIVYGMEADILGRPLDYAEANENLPEVVKENIRYNAELYTTQTSDLGICRPGRSTSSSDPIGQHEDKDSGGRTDFISQVGVCNAAGTGNSRVQACPQFENNEEQLTPQGDLILAFDPKATDNATKSAQNSCGEEGLYTSGGIQISPFDAIEADPIRFLNSLVTPSIARDACLRRAGEVCHTDLDCGPNRLHRSLAFAQSNVEFGGTDAELQYWQEELVCGQAQAAPLPGADDYYDYDMSKNRCCREVGNGFTMYTQVEYDTAQFSTTNDDLDVTSFPHVNKTALGRYSRYASVNAVDDPAARSNSTAPYDQAPIVDILSGTLPRPFQWKTLNDTGSLTCCGGGWIRKFSDGTTNWDDPTRLKVNPLNFKCLNYHQQIPEDNPAAFFADPDNYERDQGRYCLSPLEGGCSQIEFPDPTSDGTLTPPRRKSSSTLPANERAITAILDTMPANLPNSGGAKGMLGLSYNTPFEPIPFSNSVPLNDTDPSERYAMFFNFDDYFGVSFYLPSFIGYDNTEHTVEDGGVNNILSIRFVYYDEDGNQLRTTQPVNRTPTIPLIASPCTINTNPEQDLDRNEFCIVQEASGLVFHARADNDPGNTWSFATVEIIYNVQNGRNFVYNDATLPEPAEIEGMFSGNELYYLTKLGRLELLGIPQIVYEPIYCNTNKNELVDGIFNVTPTRDDFNAIANTMAGANVINNGRPLIAMYDERYSTPNTNATARYDINGDGAVDINDDAQYSNWDTGSNSFTDRNEKFVFKTNEANQDLVALPSVFAENDFRCCVKLGEASPEDGKCCSGHRDSGGLCKLPNGADLHVYFNKFVSGEGMGEDLPGGGLNEADFIPETGEPKVSSAILTKIRTLGESFCESGEVRGGAAFGYFFPEPNAGTYQHRVQPDNIENARMYSIVDSTRDFDPDSSSGLSPFLSGYRWDHHMYCAPASQ